ncbi:MAG: Rieske 2Fe-2S domain-containing protein [Verrucomicrobia subdivision 3 bacterium]|nr:Rieske 2Fe-2S domain-containing protein [Limisphaerales bacterium]
MKKRLTPLNPQRRGFIKRFSAGLIGGVLGLVPFLSGLAVLFDPLRRKSAGASAIHVASLSAIPEDGTPRKFSVLASRADAWNKSPQTPIGAVYLRRTGPKTVKAFNVVCPHAGCFVEFVAARKSYYCPCHRSAFALDGAIASASPAKRGLDELEVEIRNGTEVWVKFQNFLAGKAEKIPA